MAHCLNYAIFAQAESLEELWDEFELMIAAHIDHSLLCNRQPFEYKSDAPPYFWRLYDDGERTGWRERDFQVPGSSMCFKVEYAPATNQVNTVPERTTAHSLGRQVKEKQEALRQESNQEVTLRAYIGGVRRKTDEITAEEARNVRIAARTLAIYLADEYKLDSPPESPGEEGKQDRTTPHGHPIRDAAEMEQIECPYPPDSDIQNDLASTILEASTTELEDTGTIPVREQ